jgi:hypothetical protein
MPRIKLTERTINKLAAPDLLLAHTRHDAAHALLNTSSLLEHGAKISAQLRLLNILAFASVCLLGAIVVKLYPQLLSGLHLQ